MLRKDFEQEDPYALVGQGFPSPEGHDAAGEMARCFVEEYALIGFTPKLLLQMFQNPFYQGPYGVYCARGESYVLGLIGEVFGDLKEGDLNA